MVGSKEQSLLWNTITGELAIYGYWHTRAWSTTVLLKVVSKTWCYYHSKYSTLPVGEADKESQTHPQSQAIGDQKAVATDQV